MKCKYCGNNNYFADEYKPNKNLLIVPEKLGSLKLITEFFIECDSDAFYIKLNREIRDCSKNSVEMSDYRLPFLKINYCPICGKDLNAYHETLKVSEEEG